jgi:predicted nucleic acid-binding protein
MARALKRVDTHQLLFDALVLARRLECDLITADGVLWRKVRDTCPWVQAALR